MRYAVEVARLGRVLKHTSVMVWREVRRLATTLQAMVAIAQAFVPACTAEQVKATAQAGELCVMLAEVHSSSR